MRDENSKYKLFTRRSLVLGGLKLALFGLITGRYYYLQIIKSDLYSTLSDRNRIKLTVLPSERGKILDRNGIEIASNTVYFKLALDPIFIKSIKNIINDIENATKIRLGLEDSNIKKLIKKRNSNDFICLKDNLSWEEIAKIYENDYALYGIDIIKATHRNYFDSEVFAHITGYIGSISDGDSPDLLIINLNSNQIKIGKMGIEKKFDSYLLGKPGYKRTEVDSRGKYVRILATEEAVRGEDVTLTIDADLQKAVHNLMISKGISGAAVVMNVHTGEIIGMNSTPSFDPNKFVDGVSVDYWGKLLKNENYPMINNAISTPYPPGSTFKLAVALAALESGIDPNKKVFCNGSYKLGNRAFKCWKTEGHGEVDLLKGIYQSCNPYFFTVAMQIGFSKIASVARKLGLGAKTNIELTSENQGLIPDHAWKKRRLGSGWYPGDTVNASIGQGYVLATPIQIALMTARIATGKKISPTLILNDKKQEFDNLDFAAKNLELVKLGMMINVNEPQGSAFKHHMSKDDFIVCGKTGTAQVVDLKFKNSGKKFKHHALFTSFAPYDNPKYIVSVVVEHGEAGNLTAAPLVKEIYNEIIKRYY
jgi:penicillin-binding protein 2